MPERTVNTNSGTGMREREHVKQNQWKREIKKKGEVSSDRLLNYKNP